MKIPTIFPIAIAAAFLAIAPAHSAEKDDLESLPPAVQKTARELVGSSKIEEVEDTFEDGKRAHEVEFERDGKKLAIVISEEGKLIQTEHRISVGETPANIKAAVEKQFPGASISHIKEIEKGAAKFFEISVKAGGKSHQLKLTAEGKTLEK